MLHIVVPSWISGWRRLSWIAAAALICAFAIEVEDLQEIDTDSSILLDDGRAPDGQYTALHSEYPGKLHVAEDYPGQALDPAHVSEFSQGRVNPLPDTMPGIAGPKYGLPGYKESHNWEVPQVNVFSAAVFDWKFYASMYGLNSTRIEVRENWAKYVKTATYPHCRQGHYLFSVDKFIQTATPEIKARVGTSCLKGLEEFLSVGIYEGANGRTFCEVLDPAGEVAFNANQDTYFGQFPCPLSSRYVMTFWLRFDFAGSSSRYRNLFNLGSMSKAYPKSPAVYQYPSTLEEPATRMSFVLSSTDDNDFKCDPEVQPEVGDWVFVALSVQEQAMQVYYNAVEVCNATTPGRVIIPERSDNPIYDEQQLQVSDLTHQSAFVRFEKMLYFSNYEHTGPSGIVNGGALAAMSRNNPPAGAVLPCVGRGDCDEEGGEKWGARVSLNYPMDHLVPKKRPRYTARETRKQGVKNSLP